ncbi:MAG: glycosyltransferase, partial [Thermoproteota archaeon]
KYNVRIDVSGVEKVKNITLLYVTMARIPGEKAHSIQIARMCSALSEEGVEVVLVAPKRGDDLSKKSSIKQVLDFYGLRKEFKLIKFPVPDLLRINNREKYRNWMLMTLFFTLQALVLALIFKLKKDNLYVFCREPLVFLFLYLLMPFRPLRIIYELHDPPQTRSTASKLFWTCLQHLELVIVISNTLRKYVQSVIKLSGLEKIITLHDAVDDFLFSNLKGETKSLPVHSEGKKIVTYVGQLYRWRNPEFLVDVVYNLRRDDFLFVIVGGHKEDINRVRNYAELKGVAHKIIFTGLVSPKLVPRFLALADILLHHGSRKWASPLKIFEYMLSQKPIVAPKVPGVSEVLVHGKNALLFAPSDPADAAQQISKLLDDPQTCRNLATEAYVTVKNNFTYKIRAKKIVQLLLSMSTGLNQ